MLGWSVTFDVFGPLCSGAQGLVSSLERSRAAMANDLAAVSAQNVELTEKVDTIPSFQQKLQVRNWKQCMPSKCTTYTHTHTHTHKELQKRNEALLQMYGEKAEQAEELKLDIQDLKDLYRQQINELTKR